MTLPPLPRSMFRFAGYGYTIHDMHAYGEACALAERERCAQILDANAQCCDGITAELFASNAAAIRSAE